MELVIMMMSLIINQNLKFQRKQKTQLLILKKVLLLRKEKTILIKQIRKRNERNQLEIPFCRKKIATRNRLKMKPKTLYKIWQILDKQMKAKAMLKQILDTHLKRSTITPDQAIIKQMKKLKDQKKKLESTKMNIYRKMIDLMKEKNPKTPKPQNPKTPINWTLLLLICLPRNKKSTTWTLSSLSLWNLEKQF